ncbi:hypothetical protein [Enterococcus faecium]|uniref:hypothetical protein n=1 Tax=Enterococcus faecium TaxID=1352 RepID=UPI002DB7E6C9|nr:hypothetical protein [Enterococcus faecium]MEB7312364.1 hypothetical protein [Enterococcus faecium]
MTNGTSQGLFIIIAIVIFSIFIIISYLLFRDAMKPSLTNIFTDGIEQAKCSLNGEDEALRICNPKFNNSFEITDYVSISFKTNNSSTWHKSIWTPTNQAIRTINLKEYEKDGIVIKDGMVDIAYIRDSGVKVKQNYLDNGFGTDLTRKNIITINGVNSVTNSNESGESVLWGQNKGLKLRIGKVNTITFNYINKYGGTTDYTFQVKIINE